jgi:ketosteroid isomerase-like protein
MADDEAQIRALLGRMEAGYRAKDAKQIMAAVASDAVLCSLAPPLVVRAGDKSDIGGGRLVDMTTAAGVQQWLDGFGDAEFDYEFRDLEVAASGDVAFVHGLARMGAVGQFSMWLRITFGLRKRDGAWQITYEHESVPFYMGEGFRAATDLEP